MKNIQVSWIILGVVIGTILGIALDNLGLWLSLGVAVGVAIDYTRKDEADTKRRTNNERE